jgi:hypothetical protein
MLEMIMQAIQRCNPFPMLWVSTTEAIPVPHKRLLLWLNVPKKNPADHGTPMFGTYDRSKGFAVDFDMPYFDEVTNFIEIKDPKNDPSAWFTIDQLPSDLRHQEDLVLWCGDQAVMGYKSDDLDDPERDLEGFVMDWRWRGMTSPTHFLFIETPVFTQTSFQESKH